jgi:hypothetical protein
MEIKELCNDDIKRIRSAMLECSVNILAACEESRKVMPEKSYKSDIEKADRLVYLVNVLSDKADYDLKEQKELEDLENIFKENGYTEETIKEIEHIDGVKEISDFIDNLQEERSNWDC